MDLSAYFNTVHHSYCLVTLFSPGFHGIILSSYWMLFLTSFICLSSCPCAISFRIPPTSFCFHHWFQIFFLFGCLMVAALLETFKLLTGTIIHLPSKSLYCESLSILVFCQFLGHFCKTNINY